MAWLENKLPVDAKWLVTSVCSHSDPVGGAPPESLQHPPQVFYALGQATRPQFHTYF